MDNSPEAVKGRVRSMTKAIRYKARKEGNLMKAFNDYMGSQSGISATERSAVKSSLGLSENKWRLSMSDWRSELIEVVGTEDSEKTVKEKKIKNKIIINPTLGMKEAIEAIGGTIMEVSEIEEDEKKRELIEKSREKDVEQGRVPGRLKEAMSPKEVQLQKRKTMLDMQIARDRRKQISKAAGDAPTKTVGEGYDKPDEKIKTDRDGYRIPKKDADDARDRLLAKAREKRLAKMKEETEDSLRDKRMERGGVDGNVRYDRPNRNPERKKPDPKAGMRAVDRVRDDIIKQYGKGALIDTKKKK